jgi:hypothetical protein
MSKASNDAMETLHGTLAKALGDIVKDGVTITDREGAAIRVTASAAYLKEVREFLKDNGVVSLPGTNKAVNHLASSLPFPAPGEDTDFTAARH